MKALTSDICRHLHERLISAAENSTRCSRDDFFALKEIFETMVAYLLDGEMRVFGSSYSRVVYACRNNNVDAHTERMCGVFQMRSRNFELHDGNKEEYVRALATLCRIVEGVSMENLPACVEEKINGVPVFVMNSSAVNRKKVTMCAVIEDVSEVKYDDDGRYYTMALTCATEYDRGEDLSPCVEIEVRENSAGDVRRDDLFELREMLRPYDSINVTGVLPVKGKKDSYAVTKDSLVILEPDYLVDVTDLAQCFTSYGYNEYMFPLSKLSADKDSVAMLKGTLINDVLDARLKNMNCDMEDVFRVALSKNILKAVKYGGQGIKEIWDAVRIHHGKNISLFAGSLAGKRVTVEPSFISPLYGMQGRLDVMVEYDNMPLRKDVYELKSGKAPSGDMLWKGNAMQVACYNMLLESAYGSDRRGTSALLYSSSPASPLRNYMADSHDRMEVCSLRNKIIRMVYDMAEGNFGALEKIDVNSMGIYPSYAKEKITAFTDFYTGLSGVRKAYYHAFLSFYLREMICAKTGALTPAEREGRESYSRLWRDTDTEKSKNFSIIPSLCYGGWDEEKQKVLFHINERTEHTFRTGDVVVVYPHACGKRDVWKGQILKGSIAEIDDSRVLFSPRGQVDDTYMKSHDNWAMEHDMMEKGYWAAMASLREFVAGNSPASQVILGEKTLRTGHFPYADDDRLTPSQNTAVRKALAADDFFLLQGPPGTGKTSGAIMSMVHNILHHTEDTLVLLAFTNKAVEEIGRKLKGCGVEYVRLGHENAGEGETTLSSLAAGRKINEIRDMLRRQRVFLGTVSAFASRVEDMSSVVRLDEVIVDEASQLTEIQIAGVLSYFKKWILVGDQMQLPSVVIQNERYTKVSEESLREIGLTDMSVSLFERLFEWCRKNGHEEHYAMLDTHFRMHEDIAGVVNGFYDGRLRTGTERQKAVSENPRLVFIPSEYENSYKKHEGEARRVVKLLDEIRDMYGDAFSCDTVGVVTPFRAQIAVIKDMMTDDDMRDKVTVDTVERFQGGERDIIIASMALCSPSQIRMVCSRSMNGAADRKLNVMVSRARERFILLGYEPVLSADEFYSTLVRRCVRLKE